MISLLTKEEIQEEWNNLLKMVKSDLGDMLPTDMRVVRKNFDDYLVMTILACDAYGVVNNDDDFKRFKKELIVR